MRGPFCGSTSAGVAVAIYILSLFFDFVQVVPGVSPARLSGILLIVLFLLGWRWLAFKLDLLTGMLFGLMTLAWLCLLSLPNPAAGLNECLSLCINCVIFLLVRGRRYTQEDYRLWLGALVLGGVAMATMMIVSPGAVGTEWVSERTVANIGGSQQDANEFCGYLIVAAAFFACHAFKATKYLLLVPVMLLIYVALCTGSRGGLLAVAAGVFVAVVLGWRRSGHRMTACVMAAAVLTVAALSFDAVLSLLPSSVADRFLVASLMEGSGDYRLHAWSDVLGAFTNSSLLEQLYGHGFSSTTSVTFNGLVAHNSYIEILYSCGFLGLLCYGGIWAVCLRDAVKGRGMVEVASLVAFAILLCTLSAFSMKVCWGVFMLSWLRAAVFTQNEKSKETEDRKTLPVERFSRDSPNRKLVRHG